jgi:TM2 domain-containing membrane protein YozV
MGRPVQYPPQSGTYPAQPPWPGQNPGSPVQYPPQSGTYPAQPPWPGQNQLPGYQNQPYWQQPGQSQYSWTNQYQAPWASPPLFSQFQSQKSKTAMLLLSWFLGFLGVHRFYAGKIFTGILMIVTFGGLFVWVLVDFIIIAAGKFTDSDGLLINRPCNLPLVIILIVLSIVLSIVSEIMQFLALIGSY